MTFYQYWKSHCGDMMVIRSFYLHNGISNTGKMTSLYWMKAALILMTRWTNISTMSHLPRADHPIVDSFKHLWEPHWKAHPHNAPTGVEWEGGVVHGIGDGDGDGDGDGVWSWHHRYWTSLMYVLLTMLLVSANKSSIHIIVCCLHHHLNLQIIYHSDQIGIYRWNS